MNLYCISVYCALLYCTMMITTRVCRELCPHCFLFKAKLSCSRLMDALAQSLLCSCQSAMKKPRLCLLRPHSCVVLTHCIAHRTRFGVNDKQLDLLRRKSRPNVCFMGSVAHQLYIVK